MEKEKKILKFLIKKLKYASEDSIYKLRNKEEYFIYYHPLLEENSYSIHLLLQENKNYVLSLIKQDINLLPYTVYSFENFDDNTLNELNKVYSSLKEKVNSSEKKYRKKLEDLISKHNF
jgi:uncharacterized protein YfkK (UPF0435 family)